ncbi:invasion associated locus B family protein [Sagittula salina]|nr:invasion associated locus B family protein [Sagittula salina]
MKNSGLLLSLIAALSAAPALAQTSDTAAPSEATAAEAVPAEGASTDTTTTPASDPASDPATSETQTEEAPSTPVDGNLDAGQTAATNETAQQQQGPQLYIKETHNDWQMQCLKMPEGAPESDDVCQMFQLLKDGDGNNVAEVTIAKLEGGKPAPAGGTFIVPLQTLLTKKLSVSVDGGQVRQYDFNFCTSIGCFARVAFSADDIAQFKKGAKATVSLVPMVAPDRVVSLDMSLSGFTAAYDAASTIRP